jgi:hypothetical protein
VIELHIEAGRPDRGGGFGQDRLLQDLPEVGGGQAGPAQMLGALHDRGVRGRQAHPEQQEGKQLQRRQPSRAHEGDASGADHQQEQRGRHQQSGGEDGAGAVGRPVPQRRRELLDSAGEAVAGLAGPAIVLDHLDAVGVLDGGLVDAPLGGGERGHPLGQAAVGPLDGDQRQRDGGEGDQRHAPVDPGQVNDRGQRQPDAAHHVIEGVGDQMVQVVDVVVQRLLQLPGAAAEQPAERHQRHVPGDARAQVALQVGVGVVGDQPSRDE